MNIRLGPWCRLALLLVALLSALNAAAPASAQSLDEVEAREIAVEAYVYAYPLVLSELTRRAMTAPQPSADGRRVPTNHLLHRRAFPTPAATNVVRPNADTLYSSLWYDVSQAPVLVGVPDSGGRYYMIQLLDLWTDTFASVGSRTTGNAPQRFAIVGPDWTGSLPEGVEAIRSPTPVGIMIVRPRTDGPADFTAVHRFQDGIRVEAGPTTLPPGGAEAPRVPPAVQVEQIGAEDFFTTFAELMRTNAPHPNDQPILARLRRLGIVAGQPFDYAAASPTVRAALEAAAAPALARIRANVGTGTPRNGWVPLAQMMGTYGTNYLSRAAIAHAGLFMNVPEDAIYPTLSVGPDGRPLDSGRRYVLHFAPDQLPPARAFWSVTMYDARQFFTPNPIHRFAIGDRDDLQRNPDGSLDLYVQRDAPGGARDRNWLPAPAEGNFSLTLRLYWPAPEALDGRWSPPVIRLAE